MPIYKKKFSYFLAFVLLLVFSLNSCGIYRKVDAKDYPADPNLRIKKNMEEGRGFRVFGQKQNSGEFSFATSNSMWRASLEVIDFMPLLAVDYSGGMIITDWYSDGSDNNQSIKISIRFLSNEIRSDALNIKVFKKNCGLNQNCAITENTSNLNMEIASSILKKASVYEKFNKKKNKRKYNVLTPGEAGRSKD